MACAADFVGAVNCLDAVAGAELASPREVVPLFSTSGDRQPELRQMAKVCKRAMAIELIEKRYAFCRPAHFVCLLHLRLRQEV